LLAVTLIVHVVCDVTVGAVYVTVCPDPLIVPHEALQLQLVGLPEAEALS
jgi:hypothetical protein